MVFKDAFPAELEFEIDRQRLRRFLRIQSVCICFGLLLPFCVLFAFSLFNASMAPYRNADVWFRIGWFSIYLIGGLFVWALLGAMLYFAYFHASTGLHANNVRLLVEGPFLRFVSGGYIVRDRRFHFREVSSYETIQGPLLRRFGFKTLCFRIQGRTNAPPLSVVGLSDPESVRDVLCEIDASRELSGSASSGATTDRTDR